MHKRNFLLHNIRQCAWEIIIAQKLWMSFVMDFFFLLTKLLMHGGTELSSTFRMVTEVSKPPKNRTWCNVLSDTNLFIENYFGEMASIRVYACSQAFLEFDVHTSLYIHISDGIIVNKGLSEFLNCHHVFHICTHGLSRILTLRSGN